MSKLGPIIGLHSSIADTIFKIFMTSRTNLQNQQYNMNTQKHSNTNLLQSNTEEAIKAENENIIIILTNLLTHQ